LFHAPTIAQFAEVVEKEISLRGERANQTDLSMIVEQVRGFIVENYLGGQENGLGNGDSLLEREIIDPMRLYELVEFLHQTYGISLEDETVAGSNLDSIDNISLFLLQRLAANHGGVSPNGASLSGLEIH
jgi:acyl carrier protein